MQWWKKELSHQVKTTYRSYFRTEPWEHWDRREKEAKESFWGAAYLMLFTSYYWVNVTWWQY